MRKRKVVLVTGGSSGIGFDVARRLVAAGHCVYAAARRVDRMEPLRAMGVHVLSMDVTDEVSMQRGVSEILAAEQGIDVLVNNAGYGYFGAVEDVTMDEARRQLEVNLFGLARLCQLVLPVMRKQGSGRIVNISSIAGKAVFFMGGWYNVSKYSVEALSDALRMEVRPLGIDVVLVEPGPVRTDWGLIAADHLTASSRGGAYAQSASHWAQVMRWAYASKWLSSPQVVSRTVCRAIRRRHPAARYRCGRFARMAVVLHAILPVRWWDALMRMGGRV